MPTPQPLPPEFDGRPFRVVEAVRAGIQPERLRRSDLSAPVHGVRSTSQDDLLVAIAVVTRPDQFFSHTTAARLWGAPLPAAVRNEPIHVTTLGDASRMRRRNVIAHRAGSAQVVDRSGFRVSNPASTWFQCASVLETRALVAVGDHLVGRSAATTVDQLRAAIRPGSRHARTARKALDLVRVGAESVMETWLRLAVVDTGFPEPELNVDVHDSEGRFLGRVDLAWPKLRIALEYDGDQHRDRRTFQHDQRRDNGFVVNDWLVIHATAADTARPAVLFERLRQAFEARLVGSRRKSG